MTEDVELASLLKSHGADLKAIADAAAAGNREKVIDAVTALAIGLATGSPAVAALAPLGRRGIARAFGSAVNTALTRELAAIALADERTAFLGQIAEVIEVLLGQAVIQLVRAQHAVKAEMLDALGGVRADLAEFRRELAHEIGADTIRVDAMTVQGGGLGIRVAPTSTRRVALRQLTVAGPGSVGIDLT